MIAVVAIAGFGCSGPSGTDESGDPETSGFVVVADEQPAAFMSVQGTSATDVWIVGADAGDGPVALRWDGAAWRRIDTSALTGDLWWVHPTGGGAAVLVGADGLIAEVDPDGAVTRRDGPDGITFFGVWGASADDLWAVGGDTYGERPPAIWRNTGGAWAPFSDPALDAYAAPPVFYKVHGTGPDDVYVVGTGGVILRWDGAALTAEPGADRNLFTVHCGGSTPIAVGGSGSATVVHRDGAAWTDHSPAYTAQLAGVTASGDTAVAVGVQGTVARWDGAAWVADAERFTTRDLHGVWLDDEGGVWTVGGQLSTAPLVHGVIAYDGPRTVGAP